MIPYYRMIPYLSSTVLIESIVIIAVGVIFRHDQGKTQVTAGVTHQ